MQEPKSSARPLCSCQQRMTKSFRTNVRRAENLVLCSFFRNKSRFQVTVAGPDKPPFAHFTASVFMGSTLSHFKHRSSVLPVRSLIAIKSFLHFGQRCSFMAFFLPCLAGK